MLFRIWYFTQNDRSEIARVKANEFDDVQEFLKADFIKKEFQNQVEQTDIGLEWMENTPEKCFEELTSEEKTQYKGDITEICNGCDGCCAGFQIEEIEQPQKEDFELKTIYGTNDFYDLTVKPYVKAKDWQPLLARAWKITPLNII